MAASLSHTIGAVLATLEQQAPWARNRADLGDPGPLSQLLPTVVRDEDARFLLDPGAQRELLAEHPEVGQKWQSWVEADLEAEAKWRAGLHQEVVEFGPLSVDLRQLAQELRNIDPDRRSEAWRVTSKVWPSHLSAQSRWLRPSSAPSAPQAPPPSENRTAGGLIIPDASMIAVFSQSQIIVGQTPSPAPTPSASAKAHAFSDGELFRFAELVRELAESQGSEPRNFTDWSAAIAGADSDYRPRDATDLSSLALPWPRPGVPVRRGSRGALHRDHTARSNLVAELAERGPVFVAGGLSPLVLRKRLVSAKRKSEQQARGLALAWCGLLLESAWVEQARGSLRELRSWSKSVVVDGAPQTWARIAEGEARLAERAGEAATLYTFAPQLARDLRRGFEVHLELRARFDEDWMLDESTWDTVRRLWVDAEPASADRIIDELRVLCRI